jgi:hypothetical protein
MCQCATEEQWEQGMQWYSRAHTIARGLSQRYGYPVPVCSAVIAVLSPRNKWEQNVIDANHLIREHVFGVVGARYGAFHKNVCKALSILRAYDVGAPWDEYLCGLKVRAFAETITNPDVNHRMAVIDKHAINVACGRHLPQLSGLTTSQYGYISAAYSEAAEYLRLKTHETQAITWIAWRERKEMLSQGVRILRLCVL